MDNLVSRHWRRLLMWIRCERLACSLMLGIALAMATLAHAADLQSHDVRIFVAEEGEQVKRITDALLARYPAAQVISNLPTPAGKKRKPIYIAVGPASLRSLLAKEPDGAVFSVFVSSQSYHAILHGTPKPRGNSITAIYTDPAPANQFRLISMLYKRRIPVGVLVSEKTAHLIPVFHQAASRADIDLVIEQVNSEDNLNRALSRIGTAPALLAILDSTVYNDDTIHNILMTSYRSNQSLIGFSTTMVKAGALATTYSSIDDVISQLSDMLSEFDASSRLPDPQFPKYFRVIVNDSVARSLNIVVDDSVRSLSRKPAQR